MTKSSNIIVCLLSAITLCGCEANRIAKTGFISDYTRLEAQSDTSYQYLPDDSVLSKYDKFIVEPVKVYFHEGSEAKKEKISRDDVSKMKRYMEHAISKVIWSHYEVVQNPGPNVAILRTAITDLKKSEILQNVMPPTKLIGTGLGGVSLEAELIDSVTGKQIGAIIESQIGDRLSFDGLNEWGDAKNIMDDWATRLQNRLDRAHGYQ